MLTHPDDLELSQYKLLATELNTNVATAKMYLQNISPFTVQEGSKDHCLNTCIEEMFLNCEAKI